MALTNPKLFGLSVIRQLADVENAPLALRNLGLNPLDLEIIKGSRNASMILEDWVSFSRLNTPIYRTLDRLSNESTTFNSILRERAGADQTLFGNLDINGSISGSAIRYRYRDFGQTMTVGNFGSPAYRIADISTSRVSAWSSSDSRANNPLLSVQNLARISYGARVGIVENGKLEFGSRSTATVPLGNATNSTTPQTNISGPGAVGQTRIQTTLVPEEKVFDSEVPTSRIKCNINGDTVFLYAMKGIPLVFRGQFDRLTATATVDMSTGKKTPSWRIVDVDNVKDITYRDIIDQTTSKIKFQSNPAKKRFIKFYKNPSEIFSITIRSGGITELPTTQLSECTRLDFAYNNLKTFPNFNFIAPELKTLSIMRNPFHRSDNEDERKFNKLILNKIPEKLTSLNFEGTFYGSIERNIISKRLPNLESFNCGRGSGAYFNQDTRNNTGRVLALSVTGSGSEYNNGTYTATATTSNGTGTGLTVTVTVSGETFSSVTIVDGGQNYAVNDEITITEVGSGSGITIKVTETIFTEVIIDGIRTKGNDTGNAAFCPDMPENVTSYIISNNDFRSVDDNAIPENGEAFDSDGVPQTYDKGSFSYKKLTKLVTLNINGNRFLRDDAHSLESATTLSTINYSGTDVAIPNNLAGKTSLTKFSCTDNRNCSNIAANRSLLNSDGTYKFDGCSSLTELDLEDTNLGLVNFPTKFNNASLTNINLKDTGMLGGRPSTAPQEYVIYAETFADAPELVTLIIESPNLGAGFPNGKNKIHPDAFMNNKALQKIVYKSQNATTGTIFKLFNGLSALREIDMRNNKFNGDVPNFVANKNIRNIYLQQNQLSGSIPDFDGQQNLNEIYLQNNNLTGIKKPGSIPNLRVYQAANNQITGSIPDFKGCGNLKSLSLDNNQLTSYTSGAFTDITSVDFINLKSNKLSQRDLNQILEDLHTNYVKSNRSGVSINLKNQIGTDASGSYQEVPSEPGFVFARILESKGWTIGISGGIPAAPEPDPEQSLPPEN